MTQEERLNYLLEAFKADSNDYKNIVIPNDIEEKRKILRSLMNIRMPRTLSDEVIKIQDDYLKERAVEKGIVEVEDIPSVKKTLNSNNTYSDVLSIWQGDITRLACDAIVNAANSQMLGCFLPMHFCIDNCIHSFAGIQLRAECCKQMNILREKYGYEYEQPTSVPMLTEAYNLPAKKIIHVVGPIVKSKPSKKQKQQLADCYTNSLNLCMGNNLRSIAFCCISTGVFAFPNDKAAEIAVESVVKWLSEHDYKMDRIIFNVFKDDDKLLYEKLLKCEMRVWGIGCGVCSFV